jgi:holo-[acyl-carrier protein] synthase
LSGWPVRGLGVEQKLRRKLSIGGSVEIMRVGIDAQSISEVGDAIDAHGDRYRRRLFTPAEVDDSGGWGATRASSASALAVRFAAKEAVLKALRVAERIPGWTEIEVVREVGGWTSLRLTGLAEELADEAGLQQFEVSLSHTSDTAVAVVVAVERPS